MGRYFSLIFNKISGNNMTVRTKFKVNCLDTFPDGSAKICLSPVYDSNPESENAKFYKQTPWGDITLGTVNNDAAAQFTLGSEFYVDFTKAV